MATKYYSRSLGRVLTDEEVVASRPKVGWRKKGCVNCKPIIVEARPAVPNVNPLAPPPTT